FGWSRAFFVAGLPGLILAVVVLFIADPRGTRRDSSSEPHSLQPTLIAGFRRVLSMPTMWWIIASGALHNFNMYALGTFLASFLKRYHSVSVERAGHISAVIYGFGAISIFIVGWLGDRAFRRDVSGRMLVAWIGLALAIPCLF